MYTLYLLKSEKFNRHYIGVSSNVETRLKQHNSGKTKSTKPYRPWKLVYVEKYETKTEAMKREYFLKKPIGYKDKLAIIELSNGEFA